MKRTKIYCAILLIISMLCSSNFAVMASGTEFAINWLVNFEDGVSGRVYAPTPFGFIVEDYNDENDTLLTALVDDSGYVISPTTRRFTSVTASGLIPYEIYEPYSCSVMDLDGNVIISADNYDCLDIIVDDRFMATIIEESDIGYIFHMGIVDSNRNEIVPIGKYNFDVIHEVYSYFQNFKVYDENDNIGIIDYNGNFLVPFGADNNANPLCIADRYLTYDEAQNKSYIRKQDGSNIAEINGRAEFIPFNYLEVAEEDENHNITTYEYDMDGNLVNVFEYGNSGRPLAFKDINDKKTRYKTDSVYNQETGRWIDIVTDTFTGNTYTFDNSDYHIDWIYDNGLVKVCSSDWTEVSLVTMNHDVVIPFGEYDSITYCKDLDIFALGKDGKIGIARISPITVNVSGKNVIFDQNPVAKDGRTLVPLRAIFEALGATVEWDGTTQTITSTFLNTTIKLTVNTNKMYVNDQEVILDVPAEVINNRTLVPVRAISEAFGCAVEWDSETRTVFVTK